MSYTYLQPRTYYENLYDKGTVEQCRLSEEIINGVFAKLEKQIPAAELQEHQPGWYLEYSKHYFYLVEVIAVIRHGEREKTISEWMERDNQKDRRLADARLAKSPYCRNCGRDMAIRDKYYMHREGTPQAAPENILLMYECKPCNKRLTFWEDGTEWEGLTISCDKCGAKMYVIHTESKAALTSTYTCSGCEHSYQEKIDFTKRTANVHETADPFFDLDRKRFCIDNDTIQKIEDKLQHMAHLGALYADASDRTENADTFDAIKDIKQLKIAQLIETLRPVTEKAQYNEFKLGEPQLGREVIIAFNCLDAKPDRDESRSKKELQKLITKALGGTNWRLMTAGVDYRLGYLTGRLRAYEGEDELRKLVEQHAKHDTAANSKSDFMPKLITYDFEKLNLPEVVKTYIDEKINIELEPVDDGAEKPMEWMTFKSKLHPKLRVVIPARESDSSLPEFIRNYDLGISAKSLTKAARRKET